MVGLVGYGKDRDLHKQESFPSNQHFVPNSEMMKVVNNDIASYAYLFFPRAIFHFERMQALRKAFLIYLDV